MMRSGTIRLARWGIALSAVLGLGAMLRYPGGDPIDRSATRYAPTRNFLSDLGMTVAYNGQTNRTGAALFAASLLLLVASVLIIVAQLGRQLASTSHARTCARAAALVGLMTGATFSVVAFTPENRLMSVHVQATMLAFRIAPVVAALLAAAAWLDGARQRRSAVVLTGLTTLLALYAVFLSWGPSTASLAGLRVNVIAQKVVAILMVAVLLHLSAAVSRVEDRGP